MVPSAYIPAFAICFIALRITSYAFPWKKCFYSGLPSSTSTAAPATSSATTTQTSLVVASSSGYAHFCCFPKKFTYFLSVSWSQVVSTVFNFKPFMSLLFSYLDQRIITYTAILATTFTLIFFFVADVSLLCVSCFSIGQAQLLQLQWLVLLSCHLK